MKKQNNFLILLFTWSGDLISTIGSGLTAFVYRSKSLKVLDKVSSVDEYGVAIRVGN